MNMHAPVSMVEAAAPEPPHNIEAEQALLGAVLVSNGAALREVAGFLKAEHFFEEIHARIFDNASRMVAGGGVANAITLKSFLPDQDLGGMTVAQYLVILTQNATTIAQAPQYARAIVDLYGRREIIRAADEAIALARDCPVDASVGDQIRHATTRLSEIADAVMEKKSGATRGGVGAIAQQVFERASDMMAGKIERPPSTGLRDLDTRLPMGGLNPSSLYVLAGRTGTGKTLCATAVAGKVAARGLGAMYFSLEVSAGEIASRVICSHMRPGEASYGDFMSGKANMLEMERFEATRRLAAEWPLHIDDSSGLSMADILLLAEREANRMARRNIPLKLIVIDHAGLVQATPETRHNKVDALGLIANSAKVLAKRLDTCVTLCAQINRSVEAQEDKRPSMAQIRASGEIEEAADAILLLYRESYYIARSQAFKERDPATLEKYERLKNTLEVIVDKSRQGATGTTTLWCDPARSALADQYRGAF